MEIPDIRKKWPARIYTVTIGAGKESGGTRTSTVTIGGETTLPFYLFEGEMPHPPVVAMEVWDIPPEDWPDTVRKPFEDVMSDPGAWAKKCVETYRAQVICLRLKGLDPLLGDRPPDHAARAVRRVLESVGVPLIIWGSGKEDKDNEAFPAVAEAAKGENCLLGTCTQTNYKTMTALATAYGHKLIAESPVDINIAKQVNILAHDSGFPLENLVIFPSTGALGYGIEYVYSIMERTRLAGLGGDRAMAMAMVCDVGAQSWGVKEAKAPSAEWGDPQLRGPLWEATAAYTYLMAGADLLILRHPHAVRAVEAFVSHLWRKEGA